MKSEWAGTRLLLRPSFVPLLFPPCLGRPPSGGCSSDTSTFWPQDLRTRCSCCRACSPTRRLPAWAPLRSLHRRHLLQAPSPVTQCEMRPPCPHPPPLPHILMSVLTVNGQHAVYYAVFILSLAAPGNSDFCLCSSLLYSQRLGQRVLGCLLNE